MKTSGVIIVVLTAIAAAGLLLQCGSPADLFGSVEDRVAKAQGGERYTVSYNANGAESGSVPKDVNSYKEGKEVTVLGNPGGLLKGGHSFNGWNTTADGTGQSYTQGQTFEMGSADVVLWAKWTTNPTYRVIYRGNEATGGEVPEDTTNYEEGQTVTVLGNTGGLTKDGGSFSGWNLAADGSDTGYSAGETFNMGSEDVELFANWTPLWVKSYGSMAGNETATTAFLTEDGGCIVAGTTDAGSGGGTDIYVFKVDEAGGYEWQYSYGGGENEDVIGADMLPDGRIVVIANTIISGSEEILIICLNADGTINWQKTYGESNTDLASAMDISPAGDIYICGAIYNPEAEALDRMLCKLNSSGEVQWDYSEDLREGDDYYNRINLLDDGTFFLLGMASLGQYSSAGDKLDTSLYSLGDRYFEISKQNDGYISIGVANPGVCIVQRHDLNGDSSWLTTFTGDGAEEGVTFRQYADGSIIAGGYSSSTEGGDEDIFFLFLNSEGDIQDHAALALSGNQELVDFNITDDNGYLVCGNTDGGTGTDILLIRDDENLSKFTDQLENVGPQSGPLDGGGGSTGYLSYTPQDYVYDADVNNSSFSPQVTSFLQTSLQ